METNFWKKLARPILALSPMDGVTDAPFRRITAKYGKPDIHFTEFTNVEGLARNAAVMLDDFIYSEAERPVIAQIYGSEPESFYKIAVLVCALGFDGVDINMGCPAKKVAARGCGAGLIRTPDLAKEIIRQVKRGVRDWSEGLEIEALGLKPRMKMKIDAMNRRRIESDYNLDTPPDYFLNSKRERYSIPVSVKTRIGYDSVTVEDWVRHLLEEEPVAISIHGRTLKQMYTGEADWDAIARAAEIIKPTGTLVLGNGDLNSYQDIIKKIELSRVDGVLIGRGAMGNPWIFSRKEEVRKHFAMAQTFSDCTSHETKNTNEANGETFQRINLEQRFEVLIEHAHQFESVKGLDRFAAMRKHFGWYCKGLPGAAELRNQLFKTKSPQEVESILDSYRKRWVP